MKAYKGDGDLDLTLAVFINLCGQTKNLFEHLLMFTTFNVPEYNGRNNLAEYLESLAYINELLKIFDFKIDIVDEFSAFIVDKQKSGKYIGDLIYEFSQTIKKIKNIIWYK